MDKKTNIIIYQLGSPKSTSKADIRSYLREFLSDRRVIDAPRIIWFFVLNLIILTFRPKKISKAYQRIEFCGFLPLIEITKSFVRKLRVKLGTDSVYESFILSEPRLKSVITTEKINAGEKFIFLPQFPQFSHTTTSSCIDKLEEVLPEGVNHPQIEIIKSYHRLKGFIDLSVRNIEARIAKHTVDNIVISFHGLPIRYITQYKDPYYLHCVETFLLIKERVKFDQEKIHLTFQSRLGGEAWLSPYADEFVTNLVKEGEKSVAVYCPSFVVDCLETTDEIGNELAEEVEEEGGELVFVPALNCDDAWVESYGNFVESFIANDYKIDENQMYSIEQEKVDKVMEDNPQNDYSKKSMPPKTKKTIKIIFLTLFLDLVGFSIIFPMFPALAEHYLTYDGQDFFLKLIFGGIESFTNVTGGSMSGIVLFGGALGAIYSILQFFAAPLWGGLSDKYGRKPILLISVFGLFLSYVLWFFSGSFTLLILARLVGGIMGGNLSTATAAIADVTDSSNRSKGMAFVGIAFALGFIIGPALGGILTTVNPVVDFPDLLNYGINPFSYAAGLAAILSLINFVWIYLKFEETHKPKKDIVVTGTRTANILKLFKPLPYRDVNLVNYAYFLFIAAFSGMEFTLTFVAVERLGYTPMDNAYMFIFIGVFIALTQGGFVRRKANTIGEKKMAMMGLATVIPGLILIAFSYSTTMLYLGLLFLSIGSAMAIPTLTALVSLNTPEDEQGRSLGIFRSLGSLGRVVGPIAASLIYYKMNSAAPYLVGSMFIFIPLLVLKKVKQTAN